MTASWEHIVQLKNAGMKSQFFELTQISQQGVRIAAHVGDCTGFKRCYGFEDFRLASTP
jgi:hypothetical protein